MKILLSIFRDIERDVREKFITCGCEIVLYLYYHERAPAGSIYKTSRYSSTSFYSTLKRLAEDGILVVQIDPEDKRSNLYTLSDDVRQRLDICMMPLQRMEPMIVMASA